MRGSLVAFSVGVCLLTASLCRAQVREGIQHFELAEFDEAQRIFEHVIRDREANEGELRTAYLYLASLALMSDEERRATRYAVIAVILGASTTPPPGAPEELARTLSDVAARDLTCDIEVMIAPEGCSREDDSIEVRAVATGCPSALLSSVELRCLNGWNAPEVERRRGEEVTLDVSTAGMSDGDELICEAWARTDTGEILGRSLVEDQPCLGGRSGTRRRRLWIGLGVGLGAAALATVLAAVLASRGEEVSLGPVYFQSGGE